MGKPYMRNGNSEWDQCKVATQDELIAINNALIANRKLKPFCATQKGAVCVTVGADEETGTLNNVAYQLYEDSAGIATKSGASAENPRAIQWDVSCSRDKMSNLKTCTVHRGDLWVSFRSAKTGLVSIGNEHYVGSVSSIKVGPRRFDTSDQDGNFSNSAQIIALLKDGQPVVTRYMRWPYRTWIDDEWDATGFQAAAKLAVWLLQNGKFK